MEKAYQKGWNEVLPFARVLNPELKPAANPNEEQTRNQVLLSLLGKLKADIPEVEKSMSDLAAVLRTTMPARMKETFQQLGRVAQAGSFQEFDAVTRMYFPSEAAFAERFAAYERAGKLCERTFILSQMVDYLSRACPVDVQLDFDRRGLLSLLKFETILNNPDILPAREEHFERWKTNYQNAYRKAHRIHYEKVQALAVTLDSLRPQVQALLRMNRIIELGPTLPVTGTVADDVRALDMAIWLCPDRSETGLGPWEVSCPRCGWRPDAGLRWNCWSG